MSVQRGEDIRIIASIRGYPTPKARWQHNGEDLRNEEERIKTEVWKKQL